MMENVFASTTALLASEFVEKFPEDRLNFTLSRVKRKTGVKFSRSDNIISIAGLWPWVLEAHDLLLGDVRKLDEGYDDESLDKEDIDADLYNEEEHSYLNLLESIQAEKQVKTGNIPEPVIYYEYKDQMLVGKDIMRPSALVDAVNESVKDSSEASSLKKLIAEKYLKSKEKEFENDKGTVKQAKDFESPKRSKKSVSGETSLNQSAEEITNIEIKVEVPNDDYDVIDIYGGDTDEMEDADLNKTPPTTSKSKKTNKKSETKRKSKTTEGVVTSKSSRRKSTPQRYVSPAWPRKEALRTVLDAEENENGTHDQPFGKKAKAPARTRKRGRKKRSQNTDEGFPCDECEYVGKGKSHLREHRIRHHGIRFRCEKCDKSFGFQKDLNRHMKSVHTDPSFFCEQCNKFYKSKKQFQEHVRSHQDGYVKPTYPCQMCSKKFSTKYVLATHIKSAHLGMKKSFLCPTCGRSFTQKNSYRQHANVHAGIRPYVCDICGKSFTYEKSLKEHKFLHDGVRRFKCPVCEKCFRQSTSLRIHLKVHQENRDYMCTACGKGFTQKQAMLRHERIHNGDKPYACSLCDKAFSDYSIIRRHMILIHKRDPKKWQEGIVTNVKKRRDYYIEGGPGHHYRGLDDAIEKSIKQVCEASLKETSDKLVKDKVPQVQKKTFSGMENFDAPDRYTSPNVVEKTSQSSSMSDKIGVIKNTSMPINYSIQPSGGYSPNVSSGLNSQDLVSQESLVSRYQQIEDMYSRELPHQRNLFSSSSTTDQMRSQLQNLPYVAPVTTNDQAQSLHSQSLHNQWVFPGYPPYYNPSPFPPYQGPQN